MIVIYRAADWRRSIEIRHEQQVIKSPQDIAEAWDLCELLETQTGIRHYVGRI